MVKTQRMTRLAALSALLLAMMTLLATTPLPARAADEANQSGNIVDNRITSATINPATSSATIGGAIQCSTPTLLTVYSWARQYRSVNHSAEYFGGDRLLVWPSYPQTDGLRQGCRHVRRYADETGNPNLA
jgi:hypothetical protein